MIAGIPYDAEVEYLESTGTQLIDTNIEFTGASSAGVDIVFEIPISLNDTALCGSQTTARSFIGYGYRNSIYFTSGKVAASSSECAWGCDSGVKYSAKMGIANGTLSVNFQGNVKTQQVGYQWSAETFALFGNKGQRQCSSVRIYEATISKDGFVLAILIPVRFTNELGESEGAMYDRVSRKLFRNAGTGSFTVGPDVATPVMGLHFMRRPRYTAKSYVRDGLVAMWDGIENAGGGVHDENATDWKDLIGNYDFTLSQAATVNTNHIYCNGTASAGDAGAKIDLSVATIEIVCRFINSTANTAIFMTGGTDQGHYREIFGTTNSNVNFVFNNKVPKHKDTTLHSWSKPLDDSACYDNGVNIGTLQSGTIDESSARGYIGRIGGTGNAGCECEIYCVRLYSRSLTASEIAHNCAVDRERFNLP